MVLKTALGQSHRPKCQTAFGLYTDQARGQMAPKQPQDSGKRTNLTEFTIIKRVSLTKEVITLRTRIIPESTLNPQCLDEESATEHPIIIYGIKVYINE